MMPPSLIDIFKQDEFKLPLVYPEDKDYIIALLDDKLHKYANSLGKSPYYEIIGNENHLRLNNYVTEIINTIKFWYEGKIKNAKDNFNSFLLDQLLSLPLKTITADQVFYRVRVSEEHKILKRKDLFHIPFELRNKVTTQRFSIPGFPCLYLGNSIYICWEELNRPNFHDIQTAKLVSRKPFNLYNLSYEQYNFASKNPDDLSNKEILNLVMAYPIIAACSIKIPQKRSNDPFKPEYIIPQIIMQSLREQVNTDGVLGIVYSSTKMYNVGNQNEGIFENYALPTTSKVKERGFCTDLTNLFSMTQVVAGWPVDFINLSVQHSEENSFKINNLDLDGISVNYNDTQFALLEKSLTKQQATPIPDDFIGE
ncbi:MAG: RES domain-containing protein [Spirosomaceae bacterium]|nr:RES domain-containing protein [Spirosomataceae bacterium]